MLPLTEEAMKVKWSSQVPQSLHGKGLIFEIVWSILFKSIRLIHICRIKINGKLI